MCTPKTAHFPLYAISRHVISNASHLHKKHVYKFSAPDDSKQIKKRNLARVAYILCQ